MGRLFDNPLMIILILLVIVLLFGAPKLPGMARSLGQSMRIFKSEVKEMKDDDRTGRNESTIVNGETVDEHPRGTTSGSSAAPDGTATGTATGSAETATPTRDADGTAR